MQKTPTDTENNRKKALKMGKNYKTCTINDWFQRIFSDESKFNHFYFDGSRKRHRKENILRVKEITKVALLKQLCIFPILRIGLSNLWWSHVNY